MALLHRISGEPEFRSDREGSEMETETIIRLDAAHWRAVDDMYDALLAALGAPQWHGRNLNALEESLADDDINKVRQPLSIEVAGSDGASPMVRRALDGLVEVIRDLRDTHQAKIDLSFIPPRNKQR